MDNFYSAVFRRLEDMMFSRETVLYRRLIRTNYTQIVIYGAGEIGISLKRKIEDGHKGIDILCWVDIRAYKAPELKIGNLSVKTIHQLADIPNKCVVVLATKGSVRDMLFFCNKFNVERHRILY